jgi:hypothetical protein
MGMQGWECRNEYAAAALVAGFAYLLNPAPYAEYEHRGIRGPLFTGDGRRTSQRTERWILCYLRCILGSTMKLLAYLLLIKS